MFKPVSCDRIAVIKQGAIVAEGTQAASTGAWYPGSRVVEFGVVIMAAQKKTHFVCAA